MTNILGFKIRSLRKNKGLTLDQLAELAESSKSYIWELENKSPPRPSAEKLSKIAEGLGTTMDYLLATGETVSPPDATHKAAQDRFHRQYMSMPRETQEKLHKIANLLGDEE